MPRAATQTATKGATKAANAKTDSKKTKRPPSAYNLFMAEHLKKWKEENPGKPIKEGMAAVAAKWRDAPENPKRGGVVPEKKPSKAKGEKENVKKSRSKKAAESDDAADDE